MTPDEIKICIDKHRYLDEKISRIETNIAKISGEQKTVPQILKWVCFPLILILAGLAGVNIFI